MSRPRYIIAGGAGLIGQALCRSWADSAELVVLTRSPDRYSGLGRAAAWDIHEPGRWAAELEGATAFVNLAGRNLNTRWTAQARREIVSSRTDSTRAVGRAISACRSPPGVWINASAVGIYGDRGDARLTEQAAPAPQGADFLADVCRAWEAAVHESQASVRKVILRFGVVLSSEGGALPTLARLTKLFAGGRLGSGSQWVSWVHIADVVAAISWCVQNADASGAYNVTSPEPVTNASLMRGLRRALRRPPAPPAPAFAAKIAGKLLGMPVEPALASTRAIPARLLEQQFTFKFPAIEPALEDLLAPGR